MQRAKQTKRNILTVLLYQAVTAVSGFVLPRFILLHYGSQTNGLMQLISQLLSYTTLLEFGVGGVLLAELYKPLAQEDNEAISGIFYDAKRVFDRISAVFAAFSLSLSVGLVWLIDTPFDWTYVMPLVLILALNTYFNYYFGAAHQLLMRADQKLYIIQLTQSLTSVVNMVLCVLLMEMGVGVHAVKLAATLIFLVNPVVYRLYVRRNYAIRPVEKTTGRNRTGKRDGVIHHLAYFIHRNTDVVVLSVFSGVASASVYSVYNAVILVMENLVSALSSGIAASLGNMLARDEQETLGKSFDLYEACNTAVCMAFFTVCAMLLVPFVGIYTQGIQDAQYIQPLFALLMVGAGLMYCVRMPYITMIHTAGHYAQTKTGAITEVAINLIVSLALAKPFGLVGVALGTLLAMTYRTVYSVWYLSHHILNRPMWRFAVSMLRGLVIGGLLIGLINRWMPVQAQTLVELILQAVKVSLVVFPAFAVAELLCGRMWRPAKRESK